MRKALASLALLPLFGIGLTAMSAEARPAPIPHGLTVPSTQALAQLTLVQRARAVAPCQRLSGLLYCVGLGFRTSPPDYQRLLRTSHDGQFAPMGDQPFAAWVKQRAAMSQSVRRRLEVTAFARAWAHLDKARAVALAVRRIDAGLPVASVDATSVVAGATPADQVNFIMHGKQTRQIRSYWCGPATMQAIAWNHPKAKHNQAHWARRLHTQSSGTSITDLAAVTNSDTHWDKAAGAYEVFDITGWSVPQFWSVHVAHLGDGTPAPVIEHTEELKEYFTYLSHDADGHYQTGRGYKNPADDPVSYIAIFDPWNEADWFVGGNVTWGPHLVPNAKLLAAAKANPLRNIGL